MKLKTIKNILIGTLGLPLLLAIASSVHALEATYLCPSAVELQIINAPQSGSDPNPFKYSGVMTGKITGLDPKNPNTDAMWDQVPLAGQTANTFLPKTAQALDEIKTVKATLTANKVICEYVLPGNQTIKLGTTRNLLVPLTNCEKIKIADGEVGFHCKK